MRTGDRYQGNSEIRWDPMGRNTTQVEPGQSLTFP